ncbi:MAG: phosphate ABC transporter, permease protein PstA [Chloroflexi bacterium]|nr:MAG: phosphate ABC transporter, permease protein PstA [Chloroflexota bacterium]
MSTEHADLASISKLPTDAAFSRNIAWRRRIGAFWRGVLLLSLVIALLGLTLLLYKIVDSTFGYVALEYRRPPAELLDNRSLAEVSQAELVAILQNNVSAGRFRKLDREAPIAERSKDEVYTLLLEEVARQRVVRSWTLTDSIFRRAAIEQAMRDTYEDATLEFRSWLSWSFLNTPMSSRSDFAGVRTAILGSLWMIGLTILVAFPLGVGAAIYLEEYAGRNRLNRIIQTNINNLAGVPSIIYGMLGLSIFVRALNVVTSGRVAGLDNDNGRTILAAALTMALLVLPLIIINAQEAIRAVPSSLRQASLALGATQWQTIWHHVLPLAFPGILTGNILAMSRAIGETAPLIVVGASTYIVTDPDGPFARFTALPILIYNWTSQPQEEFRKIAAAAIMVLLLMLLSLNSVAIILRNRFRRSL